MTLTKRQRKQIKQKIKISSLEELAADLKISPKEIEAYLKKIWRKEKYQKFIIKRQTPTQIQPISNLKQWLKNNWKIFAFLAFLVFTVYFNSLDNDFVSDDIGAIVENKNLGNFSSIFSRPIAFIQPLIYFVVYKIAGLNPSAYRIINLLFHFGSTWLIYLLINFFFSAPIPLITASLFAVHPILTESVSWISGAPYSNSAFFIFLSLLIYFWSKKRKFYFLSLLFFLLALLLSEKVLVFPLILLLYEFCFGQLKKDWPRLIPFFLISGFWMFHLIGLLGTRTASLETIYSQKSGLFNPFIQIPIAISSYLELIFWPKNLTLYHSEMIFSPTDYLLKLVISILFLGTVIYFFKKDRRIFFWLGFFFIGLLPTLSPLKIAWIVAERYVYLSSLGILVLISFIIKKISKNKKIIYSLLIVILLFLSGRTIIRNADWKNQDILWLATDKVSPSSPQNHNNLGDLYGRRGDLEKAVQEFQKAIEFNPSYGDAYHNLANIYQQMGKEDLAIANYQKAISFKPILWQSHRNLAIIYFSQKEFELAQEELEKAITINPQDANLYLNLGILNLQLGEKGKAKEVFQKALQIDPQNQKIKEMLLSL